MNLHYCSDGTRVSEDEIKIRYSESLKRRWPDMVGTPRCEACGEPSHDTDHTIAKARCKELHKTELIWDHGNMPRSCRTCHMQWEDFKSLLWVNHANALQRLLYLKQHDPEGYLIRTNLHNL